MNSSLTSIHAMLETSIDFWAAGIQPPHQYLYKSALDPPSRRYPFPAAKHRASQFRFKWRFPFPNANDGKPHHSQDCIPRHQEAPLIAEAAAVESPTSTIAQESLRMIGSAQLRHASIKIHVVLLDLGAALAERALVLDLPDDVLGVAAVVRAGDAHAALLAVRTVLDDVLGDVARLLAREDGVALDERIADVDSCRLTLAFGLLFLDCSPAVVSRDPDIPACSVAQSSGRGHVHLTCT